MRSSIIAAAALTLALALIAFLAGCDPAPPEALLAPCGVRTLPPQPPKSGTRSLANVVSWANQLQLAREATDRTLAECAARHTALVRWVEQH